MRNRITWLHISDIHLCKKTEWRDNTAREALIDFLETEFKRDESLRPDLIFCTGDLAFGETGFSPLIDQYAQVKDFFDKLLVVCGHGSVPLVKKRLFIVPGNHDVNRDRYNTDAQATLTHWAKNAADHIATIEQRFNDCSLEFKDAIKRLDEYAQFIGEYAPHQLDSEGRHRYTNIVDIDGLQVRIAGFNSAWTCAGPEDDRAIWLAAQWQFNAAKQGLEKANLRIGLIHHPVDWLNEADRKLATGRISTDFHFWLHGHSHSAWVVPTPQNITIAAGAMGAESSEEFGVNIVSIDRTEGKGSVYLYQHKAGGVSWTMAPVEVHAPHGQWPINLPEDLCNAPPLTPPVISSKIPTKRTIKLYGREALLKEAAAKLVLQPFLLVYGMRGNGKTSLIEALGKDEPLVGKEFTRIPVSPSTTPDELFRQFAILLGETSEFPKAPQGDIRNITSEIQQRYPKRRPAWIWIDQAHHLFHAGQFRHPEIRNLLLGIAGAMGMQWNLVLELRECPPKDILGSAANECEVLGLDKHSLINCLADAAPKGRESEWSYSSGQIRHIYQWLGGGHGAQAHPLAIQLLIEVARACDETPQDVLDQHRGDFALKVEEVLLGDLYSKVLSIPEQRLIQTLALYRTAIPHDHAEALERLLEVTGAWDGLDRRCLLSPSADHSVYYLHNFIAGWLRTRQLGYSGHGEDNEAEFAAATDETVRQRALELHSAVASCWLNQLAGSRRVTNLNIERALEAFHHLTAAGDSERVQMIAVELFTGNLEWARQRIASLYNNLHKTKANIGKLRRALQYAAVLDPDDHKVQRFLGESWQKEEGTNSDNALECFETAFRLKPDFSPYWANLGKALLCRGTQGAEDFLLRLKALERDYPHLIDNHICTIRSECLKAAGDKNGASALRMAKINAGSHDGFFYCDEAKALLAADDALGALEILDKADKNGCEKDYTMSTRTSILQQTDPKQASALRMEKINAGSRNDFFYCEEAKALLAADDAVGALEILDKADKNGCENDYTMSTRTSILQQTNPKQASALRMEKINAGSRNGFFYCEEAKALLAADDAVGALEILDKADKNGCENDYTMTTRTSILQQTDPKQASSLRMKKINAGSRNSFFYCEEAKALLAVDDAVGALEILDKADKNGCENDYTVSIRASILQQTDPEGASALRMKKINARSRNCVFYYDEAKALLAADDAVGALEILDKADENGCKNDYTVSIRASILQIDPASALR